MIQHVDARDRRREAGTEAIAELEVLDVEADVDRQARAVRPVVHGPAADGRVVEAAVAGQVSHRRRWGAGCRPPHRRRSGRGVVRHRGEAAVGTLIAALPHNHFDARIRP